MKISYAITVCNEEVEIKELLDLIIENKREQDEICILLDEPKSHATLKHYLKELESKDLINLKKSSFNNHFGEWKNELNKMCSGDYIFNIDADETPHINLIKQLPDLLTNQSEYDLFLVPRENIVRGINEEVIKMWGWNEDDKGRINYPDYQARIYKNSSKIKWVGKVHETIKGYNKKIGLPMIEGFSLFHIKSIDKQIFQNQFYKELMS